MNELLTPDRIEALLTEFIERLGDTDEHYDGVVVGGAALALEAIPNRTATQDVDTFGQLTPGALAIVQDMAEAHDLPRDWLNSNAQQFMSPDSGTHRATHPISAQERETPADGHAHASRSKTPCWSDR